MPVPNYWTWTKTTPQKSVFLVKLLWNWGYENFFVMSYQSLVSWPHLQYNHVTWKNFIGNVIDKNFKRRRSYVSKCSLYVYSLILQNLLVSCEKMLISAEFKGCIKGGSRDGAFCPLHTREQPARPILNGVSNSMLKRSGLKSSNSFLLSHLGWKVSTYKIGRKNVTSLFISHLASLLN